MKCTFHRNNDCAGCNAYIKVGVGDDGLERIEVGGQHSPGCEARNGRNAVITEGATDITVAMKEFVEKRANHVDHRRDTPQQIWVDTVAHFRDTVGKNFTGLTKNQVKSLVTNCRNRASGGDGIQKVEQLFSGNESTAFLRHHSIFVDKDVMQRMMCFALPQLLALLMYPGVRSCMLVLCYVMTF